MNAAIRLNFAPMEVEHGNTIRFIVTNSGKIKHEMVLGAAICAEGTLRNHEKIRQWSTPTRIWSRRPPA